MPALRLAIPALLALLVPSLALAGTAAPEGRTPPVSPDAGAREELRDFALTLAPANLLLGTLKLNGEFRVADEWGLQLSLGAGRFGDVKIGEAGGQLRWYVLGDFDHGLQLGFEVMFLDVSTPVEMPDESGTPVELEVGMRAAALGPLVGYKIAFDGGFTLEAQLGIQRYGVEAYADADLSEVHEKLDGMSATLIQKSSFVAPLANLNLGWSF